jgi:crotonobetaine/carnitine-CoA ligase
MDIAGSRTLYTELLALARERETSWIAFEDRQGDVRSSTPAEFLRRVHQTAHWLAARDARRGDVVALLAPNCSEHVQLAFAASLLGLASLPIDPSAAAAELRHYLEHSAARWLIVDDSRADDVRRARPTLNARLSISEFSREVDAFPTSSPAPPAAAGGVVQLLYTSGTTSRPKGVMLTDSSVIYAAESFRAATGLRADDHHLITLPLFHAASQCHALWPSLVARCGVTVAHRFSATRFFAQAGRHGATMAALFGAPLRFLLNQPETPADRRHRLRNVTFAQNLTAAQYAEWDRRFGVPLQQLWGMTETCGLPIMSPLTGDRRLRAMGRPVLGYEVRVVDATGGDAPPNSHGELAVAGTPGRSLMLGYLHDPEATARVLRHHGGRVWLHSGDTVWADDDGFVYFVDRARDLIKRGGENISCAEVEEAIVRMPGVAEVCVVGLPDSERDEIVAAAIVPQHPTGFDVRSIHDWCEPLLARAKIPTKILILDKLPRTAVGKLQRHLVREQFTNVTHA